MKWKALVLAAGFGLGGCGTSPSTDPVAVAAGALSEVEVGISTYAKSPGVNAALLTQLRTCDNAAFAVINPMVMAKAQGTPILAAALASLPSITSTLQACVTSTGVKL